MKPLLYVVLLWVCALTLATVGRAQNVYVQNISDTVTTTQLETALPAFQDAVTLDFAPVWGVDATLSLLPAGQDAPPGAWLITVDNPQIWVYGYHDLLEGFPVGFVFADDTWQVTFTHELFEMLGNPYLDRANRVQRQLFPFYLQETGDPVEDSRFAYTRDGVAISDFVLPAWFRAGSKGPWDFKHHTTRPLQILRGGYQIAYSQRTRGWVEICYRNKPCL